MPISWMVMSAEEIENYQSEFALSEQDEQNRQNELEYRELLGPWIENAENYRVYGGSNPPSAPPPPPGI